MRKRSWILGLAAALAVLPGCALGQPQGSGVAEEIGARPQAGDNESWEARESGAETKAQPEAQGSVTGTQAGTEAAPEAQGSVTGGQAEDDVQPEAQGSMTGTQAETGAQPEREDYREVMEAARKAIEADDADALDRLQESEEGKALARAAEAEESGSVLYFPDGNEDGDGTGVGFYTFDECDCVQWYYGDYAQGKREGRGIWYYVSSQTEDGSLYQEVYEGDWKGDAPNGKGRQQIRSGGTVEADQEYKVKNGLFYGTYEIRDTLEDGTEVSGSYKLKKGKYETIPDAELEASHFEVPDGPHLAIAFLYDEFGTARSCKFIGAADATKGVKHFY